METLWSLKKIVFLGGTTVKVQEMKNIPRKWYFLKDFAEILKGKCKLKRLEGHNPIINICFLFLIYHIFSLIVRYSYMCHYIVDIIGAVHEIVSVQPNSGGKKWMYLSTLRTWIKTLISLTFESYFQLDIYFSFLNVRYEFEPRLIYECIQVFKWKVLALHV